jgi:predicted nucleic acid-binding protein
VILADTSVWIDHFRSGDPELGRMLEDGRVITHHFVIGELALGNIRSRDAILEMIRDLRRAQAADEDEVLIFIDRHRLFGMGIGYVDAHLLASARLTPDARLWTRDKRLRAVAESLSLAAELA